MELFFTGVQLVTLLLASAAVVWGIAATYSVIFPGPSGEWTGVAVYAAYMVNLPVGLVTLAISLAVRGGNRWLRYGGIGVSLLALGLPFLAHLIWRYG